MNGKSGGMGGSFVVLSNLIKFVWELALIEFAHLQLPKAQNRHHHQGSILAVYCSDPSSVLPYAAAPLQR